MKYDVKNIMMTSITLIILLTIIFIVLIAFFSSVVIGIVYGVLCIFIFSISFVKISKKINLAMENLSITIESIASDNPINSFSILEDNILSKLQNQVIKLSGILKAQSKREQNQKNAITEVISDISHQLKTPLANLNIYSEFLRDKNITVEERIRFTNNLYTQITKLNWLLENLMKMSRLETGIITLKKQKQLLINSILQAVDDVCEKAKDKNINILLTGNKDIYAKYDLKWTTECIFNILDNAVKYAFHNSDIKIDINMFELFCYISITSKGIPIKENEINKIFTRFYRGENAKDIEGVGIGLYLAREIASKQGGYIKVKTTSSTNAFIIYLPL